MKKTVKVVMLSTEKTSNLYYNEPTEDLRYDDKCTHIQGANVYKHLYLVSDDEIKEGDWYIDDIKKVRQSITSDKTYWNVRQDYLKIIATTDHIQWVTKHDNFKNVKEPHILPQIPESFLRVYTLVNGDIPEVMVEYKTDSIYNGFEADEYNILNIREDNTVRIHPVKSRMFHEDVVIALCQNAMAQGMLNVQGTLEQAIHIDDWLKENLDSAESE